MTTDDLFELPELPGSVLVVGAGAIGIELGQALARLGARVTVIESIGRAAGIEDADLHVAFVGGVRADVDLHLRHELIDVQVLPEGIRVAFRGEGGEARDETWDLVLVAAGREPRWSGIRLDAAGLDPMPPVAPGTGRVGDSHVFVAGDAGGSRMILHEAVHTGRIAGSNAARWPSVDASDRMTPLGLVFSDPQVALVGPRVSDLAAIDHVTGTAEFARNRRARVLDHTRGMVRVYADAGDGRLLGGGIVGPGAEHLGHLLAWAVQAGFTIDRALTMPFYHPVLEETLQDALRDARARLRPASS